MLLGDQFVVSTKNELTREPGPRPSPTRRDVQAGPPKLGLGLWRCPSGAISAEDADSAKPERSVRVMMGQVAAHEEEVFPQKESGRSLVSGLRATGLNPGEGNEGSLDWKG